MTDRLTDEEIVEEFERRLAIVLRKPVMLPQALFGEWMSKVGARISRHLKDYNRSWRALSDQVDAGECLASTITTLVDERDELLDEVERLRAMLATDRSLHPNGRCGCGGEGQCQWCQMTSVKEEVERLREELEHASLNQSELMRWIDAVCPEARKEIAQKDDEVDRLREERDRFRAALEKCRTLLNRYLEASDPDRVCNKPEEIDELPPPMVSIIARCVPISGEYDEDGSRVSAIHLDPGDDVRLRFDGESLRFDDVDQEALEDTDE